MWHYLETGSLQFSLVRLGRGHAEMLWPIDSMGLKDRKSTDAWRHVARGAEAVVLYWQVREYQGMLDIKETPSPEPSATNLWCSSFLAPLPEKTMGNLAPKVFNEYNQATTQSILLGIMMNNDSCWVSCAQKWLRKCFIFVNHSSELPALVGIAKHRQCPYSRKANEFSLSLWRA